MDVMSSTVVIVACLVGLVLLGLLFLCLGVIGGRSKVFCPRCSREFQKIDITPVPGEPNHLDAICTCEGKRCGFSGRIRIDGGRLKVEPLPKK